MANYRTQPLSFAETAPFIAEASAVVDGTADEVWAVLADHAGWARWFSAIRTCEPTSELASGVGSTRTISLGGGATIDEEFIAWDELELWAFTATAGPPLVTSLVERVDLSPVDDGTTTVTYRMAAQPRGGLGWLLQLARPTMVKSLSDALAALEVEVQDRREPGDVSSS